MTISEVCIRRPVFTWVLVSIPVVLGIVSYFLLGVELFPKVDVPVVAVTAILPGASAEELETTVTRPLEEAVNRVSGIDELRSQVREGSTTIIVMFVLEKDSTVAAQEIQEKISAISNTLPRGMDAPIVDAFDLDASPIMAIGVSGRRDVREVTEIAKYQIQEILQTVPGVGAVFMSGGRSRAINVIVDTDRLASYALSIDDVRQALIKQNLEVPGGLVDQGSRELVLRTLGRIESPEQFNDLIVANRNGYPIRIRDVGRSEDSVEEPRSLCRLDGENAVSLFIQKQSGTNTIRVSDAVQARLEKLKPALPPDIRIEMIQDQSRFVRSSMHEVKFHLLLAAVLVSLTILLFIRDWRTTLIATLAIPTSIVPTFLFMYAMGFTLNNITMLGLILAIGIVIDDAVVVHENIFRHMEEGGLDSMSAARKGTREIVLAVLATSLSLVVIFVPVAFMGGIIGRFFRSFGLTVAFAVLMSLFVSFTLTPMLCAYFLKLDPDEAGHGKSKSGWIYRLIDGSYGLLLRWSLRRRWIVVIASLLIVASTVPLAMGLGANLVPRDDQSEFQLAIRTPEGYTLERSDRLTKEIEGRLAQLPGVVRMFTTIGQKTGRGEGDVTKVSIYMRLKDLSLRKYSQFAVMDRARNILKDYPDLRTAVNDVATISGGGGDGDTRNFDLNLSGPEIDKLAVYSDQIKRRLMQIPGLHDVDTTLSLRKPELQVAVDRERASDLGIPVDTIANTLKVLVGGEPVSRYKEGTQQYDIWLRADKPFRTHPQSLSTLQVYSPNAGLVQLASLARIRETQGPSQIDRVNRQRTVSILANADGISLNEAVGKAREIVKDVGLPPQYDFSFVGEAKNLNDTGYYFMVALALSIIFMYMILAAQFESWLNPIAILSALPVTIPFALISLFMFRQPIDLYAMFGLFMLIGIVKKNGILQVDKTNELRRAGLDLNAAIIEANHTRLRPILMTTLMLIAAMVPIALGRGAGAGARASMAKVIIGGQLLSLVIALLVTPVIYSLLDRFSRTWRRKRPTVAPADDGASAESTDLAPATATL
ncbi:MAG TPA: efflux RND transporter permease subunit [Planctomycetaceae bacterium]|jgi:HAE1 family hydrophobic/amphiphilic exporter-1|nr:efflux RND transporter permease subunit [Planctomycetaceae bacterium]